MDWSEVLKIHNFPITLYDVLDSGKSQGNKIKREDEVMIRVFSNKIVKNVIHTWLDELHCTRDSKCNVKAEEFKKSGNKHFQMKQYNESIEMYTKCALYAPADSSNLSIAFANRSASLFHLNRYNDCIKDIEWAVKLNYPKHLYHKIYLRSILCYLKLDKQQLAKETLSKMHEMVLDPEYKITPSMIESIKKKVSETIFSDTIVQSDEQSTHNLAKVKSQITFEENKSFPYASASIDIKYNEELGRHVVANKLIKKGEILFVEKPITFTLVKDDGSINDRCHNCNCLNRDIPISCKACLYTYCSEKCLNEAWSLNHYWECPGSQMRIWEKVGISHLAAKVLFTCSTMTDETRFNQMQNLVSNFDKFPDIELMMHGITAMMITIYLSEYTNFFETINLEDCLLNKFSDNTFNSNFNISTNTGKRLYVSSLLLRHLLQLCINATIILKSNVPHHGEQLDVVATGIYPSASMMNHACNPSIIKIYMDQYVIIRSVKDIFPNEEVYNSYVPPYRYLKTNTRQERLKMYHFSCKCEACTVPELKYFTEAESAKKCLKCNGALCQTKYNLLCISCGDKPQHYQKSKEIQAKKLFGEAKNSLYLGEVLTALIKLNECLSIRKSVLYEYNDDTLNTLYEMRQICIRMDHMTNAIILTDILINAIEKRYENTSVRFYYELTHFTDDCLEYLLTNSNTSVIDRYILSRTEQYLNQLEKTTSFIYGSWSKFYEDVEKKQTEFTAFALNLF